MFEIEAENLVTIDSFDVNFGFIGGAGGATSGTFEVWALNSTGSFVGFENSMSNWTLLATVTNLSTAGGGAATPLGLNLGFTIFAGQSQSFYIVETTGAIPINLTFGTTVGTEVTSDRDIKVNEGAATFWPSFSNVTSSFVWSGTVHYTFVPVLSDDVSIELLNPLNDSIDCRPRLSNENVSVEIRNLGANPIPAGTILPVTLRVDGGATVTEFASPSTGSLGSGDSLAYTFTASANLQAIGSHTVSVGIAYPGDLNVSNDTQVESVGSGGQQRVTTYPYLENFTINSSSPEALPFGFINDKSEASGPFSDWVIVDSATPTVGTGPIAGFGNSSPSSGDGYVYVEDRGSYQTVNLRTPCFDLTGLTNPRAAFALHSLNSSNSMHNTLSVDVISYPAGTLLPDVLGPLQATGSNWVLQKVNLSSFAGQTIQLVFRVNSMNSGTSEPHDIAIDEISVFDFLPTPGQAPQQGIAELDINGARNANAEPVGLGFGGPYFCTVSAGQFLEFNMLGQAAQPIVLFSGPLNPTVATFPGIGNMDVGGAIDPLTGLPTLLTVHADGSLPGFLNTFFVTGPAGRASFRALVPAIPTGILATFQSAFRTTGGGGVALSNAVQVTVF